MEVNNTPDSMTTSSQVLEQLKQKGLNREYRYNGSALCIDKGKLYQPDELEIIRIFRFEGISNPDDMEVIYLIRASDGAIGYFQDIYGAYAGQEGTEGQDNFLRQIHEAGHDQQMTFQL
jgi:hypothetical protein